jgi:hypothetical protein
MSGALTAIAAAMPASNVSLNSRAILIHLHHCFPHELSCPFDATRDHGGKFHAGAERFGLAADDDHSAECPAEFRYQREYRIGIEIVGVEHRLVPEQAPIGVGRVVDDEQRARSRAATDRVGNHDQVVTLEQLVGEVHTPDAVVAHLDPVGPALVTEFANNRDPETVVAVEDVAEPGD